MDDRGEIYEKLLELRPLVGGAPLREVYLGVVSEEVEEVLAAVDFSKIVLVPWAANPSQYSCST